MDKIEKTFFIIKPEAFSDRRKIKSFIEGNSNLKVERSKILIPKEKDVEYLYTDDIGTDLLNAAKSHLIGKKIEAGVIQGKNAVDEFIKLCGKYQNGKLCEKNTIRKKFSKNKVVKYGNTTYYLNAVHKASKKEVKKSLEWFYNKIK
jgi:nucleoside diphosphate kinase